jgi:small conductance mechanosensitive channel
MLNLLLAPLVADTTVGNLNLFLDKILDLSISAGKNILMALLVYIVGRFLIKLVRNLLEKALVHRKLDPGVRTFMQSMLNIVLNILLIISVIGALGVNTTSFAALLASAGVAIGMALSGNLQNFAGGLVILVFKPYRVGDFIEAQGVQGTVREIQIFHTILNTVDNKEVYVPNGSMSNAVVVNYNRNATRRLDWTIGIDYGEDVKKASDVIREVLAADKRVLAEPAPFIAVGALADSSVNIVVRVWVNTSDYWGVHHETLQNIYNSFNERGINFPFPQQTVHLVHG